MMKTKVTTNKGITLIALVITIIVLLILAAVSIAMLTGDNGILTQATKAKTQTEIAEAKERAQMDIMAWQSNEMENGRNGNLNDTIIQSILGDNKDYVAEAKEHSFVTKKGSYEIPYSELYDTSSSGSTSSELPKEEGVTEPYFPSNNFEQVKGTDLTTGLVIEEKTTKNRYTWVEVPKTIYTTAKSNTDYTNIEKDMQTYASEYRTTWTDTWHSEEQHGFASSDDYNAHKNKMLKSVYEKGGFWISQYEIGYEEDSIRTAQTDDAGLTQKPVSKKGAYPYNWVTCRQAQKLATQMGTKEYTSSLMFGIQWDLILKHMEVRGKKPQAELKTDSTNWGNYKNANFDVTGGKYSEDNGATFTMINKTYSKTSTKTALITTGTNEKNSCLNIYDIAGNVWERTLEYAMDINYSCAHRGGGYSYSGDYPVAKRGGNKVSGAYNDIAFRSVLYK